MTRLRILRAKALFFVLLLVFALSATPLIFASTGDADPPPDGEVVQETYFIYLPAMANQASATTSSATLAQPPAVKQLGGMIGVLAAGFAMGIALLVWREPEDENAEESERLGD